MKVEIEPLLSDTHLDARIRNSQRQLSVSISAIEDNPKKSNLPLNLCLVLDRSGSMAEKSLETVKQAAMTIVEKLTPRDRLSVVAFDHRAKIIIPNQLVADKAQINQQIQTLMAEGGTAIDEGLKLGIKEIAAGHRNTVSQIFLLTDGENEHGDDRRCLKLAQIASEYNITINTLGFGTHWNQDVLEQIADRAGGTLAYIEEPEQAVTEFTRLFTRAQSVGLTNAHLMMELMPRVRLAELKPVAQVYPDTVELPIELEGNFFTVRLGDLMRNRSRVVLINLYINQLPPGKQQIAAVQIRYDNPVAGKEGLYSVVVPVEVEVQTQYQPAPNERVQQSILTLAKYRQTRIAEAKLQQGDLIGAATMLQTAAKTALQLGDPEGATILQTSATRLQTGEDLSEGERKKTRLVSKTILRD